MADLTDQQAAQTVKISGSNSSGIESNFAEVTSENKLQVTTPSFLTISNTTPSVTSSSTTILAANSSRKYAHISNNSGAIVYLQFNDTAVLNKGIRLNSGSIFFINLNNLYTGSIKAIKSGATVTVEVCEGTT